MEGVADRIEIVETLAQTEVFEIVGQNSQGCREFPVLLEECIPEVSV
jgi:hypothetical protein